MGYRANKPSMLTTLVYKCGCASDVNDWNAMRSAAVTLQTSEAYYLTARPCDECANVDQMSTELVPWTITLIATQLQQALSNAGSRLTWAKFHLGIAHILDADELFVPNVHHSLPDEKTAVVLTATLIRNELNKAEQFLELLTRTKAVKENYGNVTQNLGIIFSKSYVGAIQSLTKAMYKIRRIETAACIYHGRAQLDQEAVRCALSMSAMVRPLPIEPMFEDCLPRSLFQCIHRTPIRHTIVRAETKSPVAGPSQPKIVSRPRRVPYAVLDQTKIRLATKPAWPPVGPSPGHIPRPFAQRNMASPKGKEPERRGSFLKRSSNNTTGNTYAVPSSSSSGSQAGRTYAVPSNSSSDNQAGRTYVVPSGSSSGGDGPPTIEPFEFEASLTNCHAW